MSESKSEHEASKLEINRLQAELDRAKQERAEAIAALISSYQNLAEELEALRTQA